MIAMALVFIAGIIAGIILSIFALLEFIRHESRRVRRTDESAARVSDLADGNAVSMASYVANRDSRRSSSAPRTA